MLTMMFLISQQIFFSYLFFFRKELHTYMYLHILDHRKKTDKKCFIPKKEKTYGFDDSIWYTYIFRRLSISSKKKMFIDTFYIYAVNGRLVFIGCGFFLLSAQTVGKWVVCWTRRRKGRLGVEGAFKKMKTKRLFER